MSRDELIALCLSEPPAAPADEVFNITHNGDVLSTLGISWRVLDTTEGEVRCAGICLVATHPNCRGRGLMGSLLDCALAYSAERGVRLAGLWSDSPHYYTSRWFIRSAHHPHLLFAPTRVADNSPPWLPYILDTRGSW